MLKPIPISYAVNILLLALSFRVFVSALVKWRSRDTKNLPWKLR